MLEGPDRCANNLGPIRNFERPSTPDHLDSKSISTHVSGGRWWLPTRFGPDLCVWSVP